MTWNAYAALTSGKDRVWLIQVTISGTVNYLTTRKGGYTYDSQTYTQTNMRWSRIRTTQEVGRAEVSLIFPRTNALAISVRDSITTTGTTVKILQGDANDADEEFLTYFGGRVVGTRPNLFSIDLVCENNLTKFKRKAIPALMQRPCRHALYHSGGGCPVDKEDHYTAGTATAVSGRAVTVTEAAAQTSGFYSGGLIRFGADEATIWNHSGTTLTLMRPVDGLADEITASGTASVEIARGCDRSFATCQVFGAEDDFGGFPWMTDNPFNGRQLP